MSEHCFVFVGVWERWGGNGFLATATARYPCESYSRYAADQCLYLYNVDTGSKFESSLISIGAIAPLLCLYVCLKNAISCTIFHNIPGFSALTLCLNI